MLKLPGTGFSMCFEIIGSEAWLQNLNKGVMSQHDIPARV